MNDFELESKLKSVRVPERTPEYWADFPSQVRVQLRRAPVELAPQKLYWPRFAVGVALALAVICLQFYAVRPASAAIAKHERHLHEQFVRLNAGLHVLMLNQHGMSYLVADKN